MNPFGDAARALLWKELRQLSRSRPALLSSTLLPILLLVVLPLGQLLSLRAAGSGAGSRLPPGTAAPPGLANLEDPTDLLRLFLLPLFMVIGGLMVPSVAATHTVVAERERRSLELLMALPVRVQDVLAAKIAALMLTAAAVVLPLFAVDAAAILVLQVGSPAYVALLLGVLLAALACSAGIALLLALLARDFRTANNLNGALTGPLIVVTMGVLMLVPGDLRFVALISLLLGLAVATTTIALRWLTFERYLA